MCAQAKAIANSIYENFVEINERQRRKIRYAAIALMRDDRRDSFRETVFL